MNERRTRFFSLNEITLPRVSLYTDAEGGGGIGAVLFRHNSPTLTFRASLGKQFMRFFRHRKTNIIPLELGALVVAVACFRRSFIGTETVFFVDNQTVLYCCRRGRCRADDVNQLIVILADILSSLGIMPSFVYVPSKSNIADYPSRGVDIPSRWGVRFVQVDKSIHEVCRLLSGRLSA